MKELDLTADTFDAAVNTPGRVAMVDFWASWCGPCSMLAPVVTSIAEALPEVQVCRVNVDENQALCARYGIESIPTLLFFRDGQLKERSVGYVGADAIRKIIERN